MAHINRLAQGGLVEAGILRKKALANHFWTVTQKTQEQQSSLEKVRYFESCEILETVQSFLCQKAAVEMTR